ncbi:MAG: helix-turn-helix domain-containing protein, partial [Pseudomonadota bacterium]|nr:helix-turn-helix domain-containing protein [Pseudomonadota bacterium]
LHRRLESSNTSFNALLNASRLELANQYLEIPYYSLADIAHLLGYKHLSAFSRSYKCWSGITPQQARRLLR